MYSEDEMLMLSGIQHFRFCPRQWALIHIEQQWKDNRLTVEGQILHYHADDPYYRQKCGDILMMRAVRIASRELGLYGIADIIELYPSVSSHDTIRHPKYKGCWKPCIVEYKHGKPKRNEIDEIQLTAQTICLEEMYDIHISSGMFYYGELCQRIEVDITDLLRSEVRRVAKEMHSLFNKGFIPSAEYKKCCGKCSLKDICMPEMTARCRPASVYLKNNLEQ